MGDQNVNMHSFAEMFERRLETFPWYPEVRNIGLKNSGGKTWIIGGFVYRNIIEELYGTGFNSELVDVDVLMEFHPGRELYLPEGWNQENTKYGNVRLLRGNVRIDLTYLYEFYSLAKKQRPVIEDFFGITPLNTQAIAYCLNDSSLHGKMSIESIKRKVLRVNNLEEALSESERLNLSLEDYIRLKARDIGFGYGVF